VSPEAVSGKGPIIKRHFVNDPIEGAIPLNLVAYAEISKAESRAYIATGHPSAIEDSIDVDRDRAPIICRRHMRGLVLYDLCLTVYAVHSRCRTRRNLHSDGPVTLGFAGLTMLRQFRREQHELQETSDERHRLSPLVIADIIRSA
jgi:hypothetical protein